MRHRGTLGRRRWEYGLVDGAKSVIEETELLEGMSGD